MHVSKNFKFFIIYFSIIFLIYYFLEVNAGPIEIAKTFLGSNAEKYQDPVTNGVEILAQSIKEFINVCKFALKLNKGLIASDQVEFQKQCEVSFIELQNQVEDILSNTPGTSFYKSK